MFSPCRVGRARLPRACAGATTKAGARAAHVTTATGEEALARISQTFESSTVAKTLKAQLAILAVAYLSTINTLRKGGPQFAPMRDPQ